MIPGDKVDDYGYDDYDYDYDDYGYDYDDYGDYGYFDIVWFDIDSDSDFEFQLPLPLPLQIQRTCVNAADINCMIIRCYGMVCMVLCR